MNILIYVVMHKAHVTVAHCCTNDDTYSVIPTSHLCCNEIKSTVNVTVKAIKNIKNVTRCRDSRTAKSKETR